MIPGPLPQHTLKQQRERTIQQLCDGFARDRLELAEFEGRLDAANRAGSHAELAALVRDLPAGSAHEAEHAGAPATRGSRAVRAAVQDTRTLIALMGGIERRGHWSPSRKTILVTAMGGAVLDFREVDLPPGETTVYVFCLMGGAEIIVPPGLAVDASGIAIMGGFEHASTPRLTDPDTPILRINGLCVMGGVEISVREPGESARDARLRRREEKKLRARNRQHRKGGE